MPVYPNLADLRRSFAGLVRSEAKAERAHNTAPSPFTQKVEADLGAGAHGVDDVVDAAMHKAALGWGAVNEPAGQRGATRLSQEEIKRLTRAEPELGALTSLAAQVAFRKKNPLTVGVDGAPAGVTVHKTGGDKYTLAADASVPVGAAFSLVIDGKALAITRGPAGLTVDDLVAPPGYGLAVLARSPMTDPTSTATLAVTRDDPAWLSPQKLTQKAHAALVDYVKHTRLHDADWGDYFPKTWSGCVAAGVPAQLSAFFTASDTQIERKKDAVLYVGRGPFDLYTEIEVSKRDGAVKNVYVEID